MYSITDLKKGTLITLDEQPFKVVEYMQKQLGRGGSIVNVKLKNLRDGSMQSKTFKGSEKIEPAQLDPVSAQYLYTDADSVYFMRSDNYEQVGIPHTTIGSDVNYLKDGLEVELQYVNDRPLGVELPLKIEYAVESADPGIKGDSASNVMKSCQIETGLNVQVPLFIEAGDRIVVDTRDGSYVERV